MLQKLNIFSQKLNSVQEAKNGLGTIFYTNLFCSKLLEVRLDRLEYICIPSGASIGLHTHKDKAEEWYYFISGKGEVNLNRDTFYVVAGEICFFREGDSHSVKNITSENLNILMIKVLL